MDKCYENCLAEIGDKKKENINHKDREFRFDLLTMFRYLQEQK